MADGLLMFAKYAFPPNFLQLCGPRENNVIFEILTDGEFRRDVGELKEALLQFEGAVPYLRLIAETNGIKDIFDSNVVEAYWLGNNFLKKVEMKDVFSHLEKRFKRSIKKKDWFWLVSQSVPQAKPFHGFHVFDIYRRAGLLRSGETKNFLETMDKCRIGWGRVESVYSGMALANYTPLEFKEGKLGFGEIKTKRFFVLDPLIKKDDEVSLHWDYICDKITPIQKKNLIYWTNYHLRLANQTF